MSPTIVGNISMQQREKITLFPVYIVMSVKDLHSYLVIAVLVPLVVAST